MLLLEVNNLYYSVPTGPRLGFRSKRRQILTDVTFSIPSGSILGLVGGSGSGKSSLAKCIAGLVEPDVGTISIHGLNIFPMVKNRSEAALEIQMLFQASGLSLDPTMRIGDSIKEGVTARRRETHIDHDEAVEDLAGAVGLPPEVLQKVPHQLSGGQRQRAALARAVATEPSLLILDEPTSALDTITQVRVLALLKSMQKQFDFSILFITHDIATAFAFSDQIAVLNKGTIVERGRPAEVFHSPRHYYTKRLLTDSGLVHHEGGSVKL